MALREITFRGKAIDGNWYYGVPLVFTEDYVCMTAPHTYNKSVIPSTVCQFTGLTDRNGVKVFDGDILKFTDTNAEYEWIGKVEFGNPNAEYNWGFQLVYIKGTKPNTDILLWFDMEETGAYSEVIGNIHDNPELVGVE